MDQVTTKSPDQTRQLAARLAKNPPSNLLALVGPLGSGKTVFSQGFGQVFNIEHMPSPTYTLIRQYPLKNSPYQTLYHIDLYRLSSPSEMANLGLDEIWQRHKNLVLIEWADKITDQLPANHQKISFQIKDENTRQITIHS